MPVGGGLVVVPTLSHVCLALVWPLTHTLMRTTHTHVRVCTHAH